MSETNILSYLQEKYNKFGPFQVQKHYFDDDGELCFGRRIDLLDLWQDSIYSIKYYHHRTQCPCEIGLDFDDDIYLNRFYLLYVYNECKKIFDIVDPFHTGNRGYHIHCYLKSMALLSLRERNLLRYHYQDQFHAERKAEHQPFMIEFSKHRKTDKPKIIDPNFSKVRDLAIKNRKI